MFDEDIMLNDTIFFVENIKWCWGITYSESKAMEWVLLIEKHFGEIAVIRKELYSQLLNKQYKNQ